MLTAVALLAFRGATANVRYALACLGLATLRIAWLMTAIGYARAARDSELSAPALFGELAASNETAARVAATVDDAVAETGSESAPSWTNDSSTASTDSDGRYQIRRLGPVRGSVTDRGGRPVRESLVFIFAEHATLWGESRLAREARSGRNGESELTGLPPSDCLAVGVDDLPNEAWRNPDVLNRLRPLATRFHLDEGEEHVVSLRSSPAPAGLIP